MTPLVSQLWPQFMADPDFAASFGRVIVEHARMLRQERQVVFTLRSAAPLDKGLCARLLASLQPDYEGFELKIDNLFGYAALDEAALLDGCTRFQVFHKIIIPICKPMIVYQAIIGFLTPWLDFVMAKVICRTQSNYTVSLGLWLMLQKEYIQNWFARFAAAAVVISVPIAILFIVMQRFYQESMSGSVKG